MTKKNLKQTKQDELRVMHLLLAQERDELREIVQSLSESRIASLLLPTLHTRATDLLRK